jgi:hypothetical protein
MVRKNPCRCYPCPFRDSVQRCWCRRLLRLVGGHTNRLSAPVRGFRSQRTRGQGCQDRGPPAAESRPVSLPISHEIHAGRSLPHVAKGPAMCGFRKSKPGPAPRKTNPGTAVEGKVAFATGGRSTAALRKLRAFDALSTPYRGGHDHNRDLGEDCTQSPCGPSSGCGAGACQEQMISRKVAKTPRHSSWRLCGFARDGL